MFQNIFHIRWIYYREPKFENNSFFYKSQVSFLSFYSLNLFILACCEASSHNLSLSSSLPGINQYCCHMRNHGRDPCGVQTHDPEVVRQTPYPLGHRSP